MRIRNKRMIAQSNHKAKNQEMKNLNRKQLRINNLRRNSSRIRRRKRNNIPINLNILYLDILDSIRLILTKSKANILNQLRKRWYLSPACYGTNFLKKKRNPMMMHSKRIKNFMRPLYKNFIKSILKKDLKAKRIRNDR